MGEAHLEVDGIKDFFMIGNLTGCLYVYKDKPTEMEKFDEVEEKVRTSKVMSSVDEKECDQMSKGRPKVRVQDSTSPGRSEGSAQAAISVLCTRNSSGCCLV